MRISLVLIVFVLTIGQDVFSQTKSSDSVAVDKEKTNKMVVYGSDTCHYCIDTKKYLKEKKIDFIYYDVDINLQRQREMVIKLQKANISLDNLSLPVVDLNGQLIMNGGDFDDFLKKLDSFKTK